MYWPVIKIAISACIIAFASWLSNKKPELAGFIVALPITSMLVLAFAYGEYRDPDASVKFAVSILSAVPLSLLFFVPFLLAKKIQMPFWGLYASGVALIALGYLVHTYIMKQIT